MYNNDLKEYCKQPLVVRLGNLTSTMNDTLQFEDKNATNVINDNFNSVKFIQSIYIATLILASIVKKTKMKNLFYSKIFVTAKIK